jgi:hypothetical protein
VLVAVVPVLMFSPTFLAWHRRYALRPVNPCGSSLPPVACPSRLGSLIRQAARRSGNSGQVMILFCHSCYLEGRRLVSPPGKLWLAALSGAGSGISVAPTVGFPELSVTDKPARVNRKGPRR